MALDEEQSSAAQEMRRAIDCLRDCADLAEVDPATLEALAAGAVHFSLPAGSRCSNRDPLRMEYIWSPVVGWASKHLEIAV
jgi:hypothetical protein